MGGATIEQVSEPMQARRPVRHPDFMRRIRRDGADDASSKPVCGESWQAGSIPVRLRC
jgi:hypothetical protein